MAWSLRRPEPSDAEGLVEIVVEAFEDYRSFAPEGWEPPDEWRNLERFRGELADPAGFSAAVDGAGFVHWIPLGEPADVHLRYLFVRPAHFGTGLAKALMDAAVEAMDGRSARLFTPAGQTRARRFYEREGWRLTGVLPDHKGFGMPIAEYRLR